MVSRKSKSQFKLKERKYKNIRNKDISSNQYRKSEYIIKKSLTNLKIAGSKELLESLVIAIAYIQEMNIDIPLEIDLALKDWIHTFTEFIKDYWGMVISQVGEVEVEKKLSKTDIYWDIKTGNVKKYLDQWADLDKREKVLLFERVRNALHEWGYIVERFYNLEEDEALEFMNRLSYLTEEKNLG